MKKLDLNTSYLSHALIGVIISIWLVLFLVFIAPFDASDLTFNIRLRILPFYGIIFFFSYLVCVVFQNLIFKKLRFWNLFLELLTIALVYLFVLYFSFLYYKSGVINGEWSFQKFISQIYIPTWIILGFPILFARWFISRKKPEKEIEVKIVQAKPSNKIILKGDNKLDVIQVEMQNLICISSAQNYVEVFYLQNEKLQKKLLRSTLKKISQDVPEMIQVHRSHLINPIHFVKWLDSNMIHVHELDIPVSKNYKEKLKELI